MNHIEMEWVEAAQDVKAYKEAVAEKKRKQLIYRLNKKAYEHALRERKTLMNDAMRAGDYAEVSRQHKVINILRAQLKQECSAIYGTKQAIKNLIARVGYAEKRRDQFADAYRLVLARDQMAGDMAKVMDAPAIVPMEDGDMEQIVQELGY